jgi:hypothetical protein
MRIGLLSLGVLAMLGIVRADEEKIDVKNLPAGVIAAVKAKFPEGKVTGAAKEEENKKVIYEVSLTDQDVKIDVAVSAKGRILEVEKTIDSAKLPEAVAAMLKAKYPSAKIKKAEEINKYKDDEDDKEDRKKKEKDDEDDKPETFFELVLASPGKSDVEVKFSPQGKVIEEEDKGKTKEKDDDEDDKPGKKKEKD